MKKKIYQFNDLEIWQEDNLFYAIYDAGSHQVMMRKDEITKEEAMHACEGESSAVEMLLALQARLTKAGIDAYSSNYSPY
jgi:hypothetical protein